MGGAAFYGKMAADGLCWPPFFRKKQLRTHHFHTIMQNIRYLGIAVLIYCKLFSDSEKLKYVDYLIRHGAKLNVVSFRGYTPLDRCVFHSMLGGFSADCLLRLVQAGAYLKPVPGPKR